MYCRVFKKSPLGQLPSDLKWTEAVTRVYATTTKKQTALAECSYTLHHFAVTYIWKKETLMDRSLMTLSQYF